jgi:hypothetical protein
MKIEPETFLAVLEALAPKAEIWQFTDTYL